MLSRRTLALSVAALVAAPLLTACGGDSDAATGTGKGGSEKVGGINIGPDQHRIRARKVDAIAAELPPRYASAARSGSAAAPTPRRHSASTPPTTRPASAPRSTSRPWSPTHSA